jgi:hypothetical protein
MVIPYPTLPEQALPSTREVAGWRSAFLLEAGAILAASLDYEVTLTSLARLVVPRIADYCMLFEVAPAERRESPERGLRQVASAHIEPAKEPLLRRLGELYFSPSDHPQSRVVRVVQTGEPMLIHKESYEQGEEVARHPELLETASSIASRA